MAGRQVILGDTDQYAALGSVSSSRYPALNTGTAEIETIKASGGEFEDQVEVNYTIDLGPTGDAVFTQRQIRYGVGHTQFCRDYLEMSPEERKRRFQEMVSSVSRSAVATTPWKVSCDTYPSTDEFSVSVPAYAIRQADLLTLEVPGIIRSIAGVIGEERTNPLYRESTSRQKVKIEVILPEGVKGIELTPPVSKRLELPGPSSVTLTTRVIPPDPKDGSTGRMRIVMEQTSDINPALIPPKRYPELLEVQRAIANPETRTILVRMEK
jgi:hypothetical protein